MIIDNTQKIIKEEVNSSKKDKSLLYNIFKIEEQDYEENYIKINTKNEFDIYNSDESNKKLNEIIKYVDELVEERTSTENVTRIFLQKLFPKCENKGLPVCKSISKKLMKSKKITKKIIDEKIIFFFEKRIDIRYSKSLILNKENITILGYILSYSYSKFDDFKIFEKKDLIHNIKLCKNVATINEFFSYCNINGKSPADTSILDFLESQDYCIPGEFLFLMNIFDCINILEIDMNINITKSKYDYDDDFYLFIITLLNIHSIFKSTNNFKVNFNNEKFQKDIYNYYTNEIKKIYNNNHLYLKKNLSLSENEIYNKKYDFNSDYIIINKNKRFSNKEEESKILEKNKENTNQNSNSNNNDTNNTKKLYEVSNLSFVEIVKKGNFYEMKNSIKSKRTASLYNKINDFICINNPKGETPDDNYENDDYLSNNKLYKKHNSTFEKENVKSKYDIMVDNNRIVLELIYIISLAVVKLRNLNNLNLIINDCYYKEFINSFGQNLSSSKIPTCINQFHLLNNFIKKIQQKIIIIKIFNIEFNSLDYLAFYKILSILQKSDQLTDLQISFFPSLIIYSTQYIYKVYQQNANKQIDALDIYDLDSYLLHELLSYFIENLEVLFELIKLKRDKLENLNFNFDIPDILLNNKRYLNGILKFILNILFLIDNQHSKTKKLVIFSPKIVLDSRSMSDIENIINTIDMDKRNNNIEELSIQIQFYRINNIKNIISSHLTTLKIGQMDISTLHGLTKYLTSYTFFKKSSLKSLTIDILNCTTKFTKEIEYLFNEIFSLKIKTLTEINIYSNIIIKDKNILNKIFEYNWIPFCTLTLNEKSKLAWKQKEIEEKIIQIMEEKKKSVKKIENKKILYLLHHELEKDILNFNELEKRNKNKIDKTDCEIVWILKYIIIFKYSKKYEYKINYYDIKKISFNIFKFLFFTKSAKIQNEINT